jgi:hypothetical protein
VLVGVAMRWLKDATLTFSGRSLRGEAGWDNASIRTDRE